MQTFGKTPASPDFLVDQLWSLPVAAFFKSLIVLIVCSLFLPFLQTRLQTRAEAAPINMDSLYAESVSRTFNRVDLYPGFFADYLRFVEANPTPERLQNLERARASTLVRYTDELIATAKRIRTAHPELTEATERLIFPNREPAVPYIVGEWISEFEQFRNVAPAGVEAARLRLFQKAGTKGSRDSQPLPFGGFKNGAGGNRNFQIALTIYIESTFPSTLLGRRKPLDKSEFLRFITMVQDVETRWRLFLTFDQQSETVQPRCESLF